MLFHVRTDLLAEFDYEAVDIFQVYSSLLYHSNCLNSWIIRRIGPPLLAPLLVVLLRFYWIEQLLDMLRHKYYCPETYLWEGHRFQDILLFSFLRDFAFHHSWLHSWIGLKIEHLTFLVLPLVWFFRHAALDYLDSFEHKCFLLRIFLQAWTYFMET